MLRNFRNGYFVNVVCFFVLRNAYQFLQSEEGERREKNGRIECLAEKENINTLDVAGELLFTILSSLAQDGSRSILYNCKWGIRKKFRDGILHLNTNRFMGYDKDKNGRFVINEE